METRAPYALIGLFVLAAIGAVFGFVYWLNTTGGLSKRTVYYVRFEHTVSGLLKGAAVLFNGIRVGEVIDLQLNPDNPRQVTATIAVVSSTPVRADTHVGLDFQGLTGIPVIALEGGSSAPSAWSTPPGEPPVLNADPMAGQSMTEAARDALHQLQAVLAENSEPLHSTIANLNTFSAALARNSDRLDGIVAGVERMVGSGATSAPPIVYDLTAPRTFPALAKTLPEPLTVPEPTAILMFDTQKILVRPSGAEGPTFANARWSDTLPKLLQAKIIQSFENANFLGAVTQPTEGLTPKYQLLIDIRAFQLSMLTNPIADLEFTAKILTDNGRIVAARIFHATAPARASDAAAAAAALDEAFNTAAIELVAWTSTVITNFDAEKRKH
jgi:phospholipid/cholesterol/gamma-HCH transport system substrate-binding protein